MGRQTVTSTSGGKIVIDGRTVSDGWIPDQPSRGVGDTVAKMTHATGLNRLAKIYTKATGKPCGCNERQKKMNQVFPYRRG